MTDPPERRPSSEVDDDREFYLRPVSRLWSRLIGAVLLVAAAALTVLAGYAVLQPFLRPMTRASLTSSTLIFVLMLVVVWGFCWQAGWRLLFGRGDGTGSLFSWVVWLAIGVALLTFTGIAATLWLANGKTGGRELYALLSMGCVGGWCLWFAWRRRGA